MTSARKPTIIFLFVAGIFLISIVYCQNLISSKNVVSRSELGFIQEGISYKEVVSHIGEPKRDVGSGVYLFEYELNDGGILILGFSNLDFLNQAAIHEKNGTSKRLLP